MSDRPASAPTWSRRQLFTAAAAAAGLAAVPAQAQQVIRGNTLSSSDRAAPDAQPNAVGETVDPEALLAGQSERRLVLLDVHRDDRLDVTYWRDGGYDRVSLALAYWFLRDHYDNSVYEIDQRLLNVLCALQAAAGQQPLHVLSAYRSARTNAWLHSWDPVGVAWRSLHMQGRAIDIRLPGFTLSGLRTKAIACGAGGLGYYPRSEFIHVDTGPRRSWTT